MAGLGLAGGALAGLAALGALVAGNIALMPGAGAMLTAFDHEGVRSAALVAVNAIGAWLVRWLQVADPTALEQPYLDAAVAGVATVLVLGALVGAAIAAAGERFPEDAPLVWSGIAAVGLWVFTRFALAPALDPLLLRVLDGRLIFAAHVVFGLVLGAWLSSARPVVSGAPTPVAADRP